jgi:hypothetical protein
MIVRCLPEKLYGDTFWSSFLPQNLLGVDSKEVKNPNTVDHQKYNNPNMMEDYSAVLL